MARYIDADNLKLNFASYLQRGKLEKDEAVYRGEFYNWRIDGTEIKEAINREPTADVRENVKGEWFAFDIDSERYDEIKCSVCRKAFIVDAQRYCDIGFIKDDLNFCPNCGADMRGAKDEH